MWSPSSNFIFLEQACINNTVLLVCISAKELEGIGSKNANKVLGRTLMTLPWKVSNLFTSWATVRISKMILLCGISHTILNLRDACFLAVCSVVFKFRFASKLKDINTVCKLHVEIEDVAASNSWSKLAKIIWYEKKKLMNTVFMLYISSNFVISPWQHHT